MVAAGGVCAVNATEINALVEQTVLAVLARISVDGPAAAAGNSRVAEGLAAQIEADKAALAQLDDDRYDGLIDKTVWARQRNRLVDRITATTKTWQAVLPPTVVTAPINMATVARESQGRMAQRQHDAAALVLEAARSARMAESVGVGPKPCATRDPSAIRTPNCGPTSSTAKSGPTARCEPGSVAAGAAVTVIPVRCADAPSPAAGQPDKGWVCWAVSIRSRQ